MQITDGVDAAGCDEDSVRLKDQKSHYTRVSSIIYVIQPDNTMLNYLSPMTSDV